MLLDKFLDNLHCHFLPERIQIHQAVIQHQEAFVVSQNALQKRQSECKCHRVVSPGRKQTKRDGGFCILIYLSLIHISEPTRLGMISYAVFCLKKKKKKNTTK